MKSIIKRSLNILLYYYSIGPLEVQVQSTTPLLYERKMYLTTNTSYIQCKFSQLTGKKCKNYFPSPPKYISHDYR